MADLALRLKVFIASPSDVQDERDIAEREVVALQAECVRERLLLEPYRWEGRTPPTVRRAQANINIQLRTAELTVGILGTTLGTVAKTGETGSVEEIRIAGERVARGYADDVFLYFKALPPLTDSTIDSLQAVRDFRQKITGADGTFVATFAEPEEFARRFRQDLRAWVSRYFGVPEICAFALKEAPVGGTAPDNLGENRLARLKRRFDPFSELAVTAQLSASAIRMYQEHGIEGATASLPKTNSGASRATLTFALRNPLAQYQPMIDAGVLVAPGDGSLRFGHEEWFFFFCAYGLLEAVSAGDMSAVERRPYINPIHQYLQALAIGTKRPALVSVLRRWLVNADGTSEGKPIARNFAAYVLGMVNAIEAQEDMARVINEDTGEDVQTYCVASLGRMRARGQLPVLVELFKRTDDSRSRLMIAQAVSRMIGIADYPL